MSYRLFINTPSGRQYVQNPTRDGFNFTFSLTPYQDEARKFIGGGSFSGHAIANVFEREEVVPEKYVVKYNAEHLDKNGGFSSVPSNAKQFDSYDDAEDAINELEFVIKKIQG